MVCAAALAEAGATELAGRSCATTSAGGTCGGVRAVRPSAMPGRLTLLVVAGVTAILVVAAIDALRRYDWQSSSGSGSPPTSPAETAPVPLCGPEQLTLTLERLDDDLALVLRNVGDTTSCRARRLPIQLLLLDEDGFPAEATATVPSAFGATTYSPDVEVIVGFTVLIKCGAAKPAIYRAGAGSYHAGGRLPEIHPQCLHDLGP
jgi:hypothetical protein